MINKIIFSQRFYITVVCSVDRAYFQMFPAAFCLQVFLIGPLVRRIFRVIFKKQFAK